MPAKKFHAEEGFTLIELLVVIIIIGILAAIAIPVFFNQRGRAFDARVQTDVKSHAMGIESYMSSNPASEVLTQNLAMSEGARLSEGVVLKITGGTQGYCIVAAHPQGKRYLPATPLTYDSLAGGLGKTGGACSNSETMVNNDSSFIFAQNPLNDFSAYPQDGNVFLKFNAPDNGSHVINAVYYRTNPNEPWIATTSSMIVFQTSPTTNVLYDTKATAANGVVRSLLFQHKATGAVRIDYRNNYRVVYTLSDISCTNSSTLQCP